MEPIESCTPTKKRQPNFSTNDCLLLIEIMGEDSGFERMSRHVYLRHRFTDKITASSKKLLWKNISEIFTSKAHVKREWSELSKKWDNLVQKHRALYMDYVQSQQRTGGGPCSGSKLSVITDAVMAVVGKHSVNVMGITGTAIGTNDTTWTALTSTMQSQTKCSDGMTESEWNTLSSRQHTAVPSAVSSAVSSAVPSAVPSALSSNTSMDIYEPLQDMNTSTATISTFDAGLGDVEQVLDNRAALRSEAFTVLKPFCVQLTRDHSRENIAKLFNALQSVDILFLQDLQEYVIFPLRIILKHPKKCSQDLYLDLYTCMEYVLGHTKVTRWDLFQDIFHTATTMLSCPTDQTKVARLNEELKLAIIQTLRTLVKNSECSVIQQLYTILCLPLLGHSVSLLLNIAEVERARNLRILAMECLLDFSQADSKLSQCLKADIGNMYASFLPGISVALCKIITGDTKHGFIISKAIYVWMRIVSLVMDDRLLDVYRQKQASKTKDQKDLDERLAGLVVTRDTTWITTTSSNLCILVKQVASVRSHCNWRVRLGLVECAEHLLLHCNSSMKDCVPQFLEILVSLIGDDFAKVATGSRRALDLFTQSQATDQQHRLTEILEENLHKLATSLPRQIQTAEEEDKMSLLSLLAGYISLLGGRVKNLLLSLPHLKRLSLALMQILELECSDVKIIEERTTITGHGSSAISESRSCSIIPPRKYFKHFTNQRILEKVQGVCHLLGYYGDIHLLVDHFLDIFHESSMFKLQATLVINEIMLGTTGETGCLNNSKNGRRWLKHSKDELDAVIRMLIDEYLNPVNFDLMTSVTSSGQKSQSLEQQLRGLALTTISSTRETTAAKMNKNIVQISLYLEGFGNFAKVLKTSFEPLMMQVLYPMLEKLGDETAYISNTAFVALWDMCTACKYKSLDEMIRENSDYLMNAISLRLRHLERNRKCPLVLKVMFQYSSAELLPLIDDTIKEILESLDENYTEESVLFMGVLNELSKAVLRWFPDSPAGKTNTCKNTCSNTNTCKCEKTETEKKLGGCECTTAKESVACNEETKHAVKGDKLSVGNMAVTDSNVMDNGIDSGLDTDGDSENVGIKTRGDNFENVGNETRGDNFKDADNEMKADSMPAITSVGSKTSATEMVAQDLNIGQTVCHETDLRVDFSSHNHPRTMENTTKNCVSSAAKSASVKCPTTCSAIKSSEIPTSSLESSDSGVSSCSKGSCDTSEKMSMADELVKYFSNLHQLEREAEGEINQEDLDSFEPITTETEDTANSYAGEETESKKVVPPHVSAISEVLLRCKHIISSRNPRLRLLVLDTVGHTCLALKSHQDELLPLIHKIWPPFSLCFADEEKLVTIKAIEVLQIVARCSGDFVKHRITKDVLPKLASFLHSQAQISIHAGSSYQFTVNYKLQLSILRNISAIAKHTNIHSGDLDNITTSCLPYLHEKQPVTLQLACMDCCKELIDIDADVLWLKLCSMYSPQMYPPPDNRFTEIKALRQASSRNEYAVNVTRLMRDTSLW